MLVSTAISRIKTAGHDISDEYSNERCLEFLNNAMQQVAGLLISAKWPSLVKTMLVHDGDSLPKNYMQPAGSYPIRMTDGKAEIIDEDVDSVRFRYFATPENLTDVDQELPFNHDAIDEVVVRGAIILALNENEYDLSQDTSLWTALQQAIASGMA